MTDESLSVRKVAWAYIGLAGVGLYKFVLLGQQPGRDLGLGDLGLYPPDGHMESGLASSGNVRRLGPRPSSEPASSLPRYLAAGQQIGGARSGAAFALVECYPDLSQRSEAFGPPQSPGTAPLFV